MSTERSEQPAAWLVERLRAAGCVYAEEEAALLIAAATDSPVLERLVAARETGTPLEQVLGWAEFADLRVPVRPGVFVPRRRSAVLVDAAVQTLHRRGSDHPVVVDVGCGTGALGAALAARLPDVELWSTDVDPAAIECARLHLPADRVLLGDLLTPLPDALEGRIDLVIANLPYVPTDSIALMPPEARDHEHRVALDGGPDGLDLHRRLIGALGKWLAPTGQIALEASIRQVPLCRSLLTEAGFAVRIALDEAIDGVAVLGAQPDHAACEFDPAAG